MIQVRFSHRSGKLDGEITHGHDARKIVFVAGYRGQGDWRGLLPQDGEEWLCQVVKDTNPDNPRKGALLVRPIKRAEPRTTWEVTPSPQAKPLLGASVPCVKRTDYFGERQSDCGYQTVYNENFLSAEWPEEVKEKCRAMLGQYEEKVSYLAGLVPRPAVAGTQKLRQELEVEGLRVKVTSELEISDSGLWRAWEMWEPARFSWPDQLISDQIGQVGETGEIQSYEDLVVMCRLLGIPQLIKLEYASEGYRGRAEWEDFSLRLDHRILKGAEVVGPDENGTATFEFADLGGIKTEIKGLRAYGEDQKQISLTSETSPKGSPVWRPRQDSHGWGEVALTQPIVEPAGISVLTAELLSPEEVKKMVEQKNKWSLKDHEFFFRSAILGKAQLANSLKNKASWLASLINCQDARVEVVPHATPKWTYESNDGMGTRDGGGDAFMCPTLSGSFGQIGLSERGHKDFDQARQWLESEGLIEPAKAIARVASEKIAELEKLLAEFKVAFSSKAVYESKPTYEEPPSAVSEEEWRELNQKAEGFFGSIQKTLDGATKFVAQV